MKQRTGRLLAQTLLAVGALVPAAGPAVAGPSLTLYERITVHIDGSADIALLITRQDMPAGPMVIPCAYAGIEELVSPDSGVVVRLQEEQDIRFFRVEAGEQEGRPVTIRMVVRRYVDWGGRKRADFGNMTLTHTFRNTTSRTVTTYRGDVLLPEWLTVTSVVSSIPAQTEKDPVSPFDILRDGGRTGVSIRTRDLRPGEAAAITFRCKPVEKSPVLFGLFALAGLAYLIFFRDVLKENTNGPSATQNPQP
jgi:hypothetical protein